MALICTPYAQMIFTASRKEYLEDGVVQLSVPSWIVSQAIQACYKTETGKDMGLVGSDSGAGYPPD